MTVFMDRAHYAIYLRMSELKGQFRFILAQGSKSEHASGLDLYKCWTTCIKLRA